MRRHIKVSAALLAAQPAGRRAAATTMTTPRRRRRQRVGARRGARRPGHQHRRPGLRRVGRSWPRSTRARSTTPGYEVGVQELGGFRDLLFGAFESGEVNLAPDYVASELEFLNDEAGEATSDVDETLGCSSRCSRSASLVGLTPVRGGRHQRVRGHPGDLRRPGHHHAVRPGREGADLTLGAPPDCESNAFCIPGLQRRVRRRLSGNFSRSTPASCPRRSTRVRSTWGVLFSTDGRIASEGWVLLEDDQKCWPPTTCSRCSPGAGRRLRRRPDRRCSTRSRPSSPPRT